MTRVLVFLLLSILLSRWFWHLIAAFMEGLDLRVRDGKPCEALARVEWARRGLGGEIPGLDPAVGQSLVMRCDESRRPGRAMSQQRRGAGRTR